MDDQSCIPRAPITDDHAPADTAPHAQLVSSSGLEPPLVVDNLTLGDELGSASSLFKKPPTKPNPVLGLVRKIKDKSSTRPPMGSSEASGRGAEGKDEWVIVQDEANVQHEMTVNQQFAQETDLIREKDQSRRESIGSIRPGGGCVSSPSFPSYFPDHQQAVPEEPPSANPEADSRPGLSTCGESPLVCSPSTAELLPSHRIPPESTPDITPASASASALESHDHVVVPPSDQAVLDINAPGRQFEPRPSLLQNYSQTTASSSMSSSLMTTEGTVPRLLQEGVSMLKVSAKKVQQTIFKLDGDKGTIEWPSKKGGVIDIESIREIRLTNSAQSFIDQFSYTTQLSPAHASRWITIIYTSTATSNNKLLPSSPTTSSGTSVGTLKWKALHLVALDSKSFAEWSTVLQSLWDARRELMGGIGGLGSGLGEGGSIEEKRKAVWMKKQWRQAEVAGEVKLRGPSGETERNGWLDFEGVLRICRRLNIASSRRDLYARFQEADVDKLGHLDFASFQRFVKKLKERKDIERLLGRITNGAGLDEQGFRRFLREEQKVDLPPSEITTLFLRYAAEIPADSTSTTNQPLILLEGLTSFLLSSDNSVMSDSSSKVSHDMTRPLPEYFVSSSHNTYLIGHQLVGDSTVEGYIRALLQGCRSVELDCYDGDNEPVVYHGRTLTSKVPVRDVVHAIGKYAFVASPYPIIISAEIHCSVEQQDALVRILKEVLGIRFLSEPLSGWEDVAGVLPSPEDLKHRILLKAKIPIPNEKDSNAVIDGPLSTETDSTSTNSESGFLEGGLRKASALVSGVKRHVSRRKSSSSDKRSPPPSSNTRPQHYSLSSNDRSTLPTAPPLKAAKPKFSPALAQVLIYTLGVKYRGFNKKEVYDPSHMISLSERTANKILKQSFPDVVKHNRTHLMRLYPSVTRLGSSNYDPIRYWAAGAQLVTINWQSIDTAYMLNGALFAKNGRSGYVLKPAPLRTKSKDDQPRIEKFVLRIKQLPSLGDSDRHPTIDPFVEVTVFFPDILPASASTSAPLSPNVVSSSSSAPLQLPKSSFKVRTKTVDDNGFDPAWEENLTLPFRAVMFKHVFSTWSGSTISLRPVCLPRSYQLLRQSSIRFYSTPSDSSALDETPDPLHYHVLPSVSRVALSFLSTPPAIPTSSTILGYLPLSLANNQDVGLNDFEENKPFVGKLQQAVRECLEEGEERISAEASGRGEGWVHVCDDRNYPMPSRTGEPEDLIGSVYVKDGKVVPSTYQPMNSYRVLTNNGPPQPPGMMSKLLQVLERTHEEESKSESN
ncbi:Phosphoinositide-specific phospholipase C [Phaffia rhodozyma]|uniref:Phosphoinositide phospholipase C n=1 Tax=Phaffia rhodozyma TaxID=264483 RepID=A0A0F7SWE9_PHARH|nr:Phosphoinositide-specific phospholipase C [Phaffia rhodozyma]